MPPTSWKKSPAELVERFASALPKHPAVVRKPIFGYPAAFANGNMAALFAFLHHLAAFALVSAIAVEFALIKGELNVANARKILRADQIYGAAAGALLVIGLLRVFFFEKGAAYYFHSVPFIAKLSLFAAVGLLSISPTRRILSWRAALKEGRAPSVTEESIRSMRAVIHWELAGVVLILLCAALMARGVGYFGACGRCTAVCAPVGSPNLARDCRT